MTRRVLLILLLTAACARPAAVMRRLQPPGSMEALSPDEPIVTVAPDDLQPWPPWQTHEPVLLNAVVDIGEDGAVTGTQVRTRLLSVLTSDRVAAFTKALNQWRFKPGERRLRHITFSVEERFAKGETHVRMWSQASQQHVVLYYDNVARRSVGEQWRCPLHHEQMVKEEVPLHSGFPAPPPSTSRRVYLAAAKAKFPYAWTFVEGTCDTPFTKAEIFVCRSCWQARDAWLAAHGGEEPLP